MEGNIRLCESEKESIARYWVELASMSASQTDINGWWQKNKRPENFKYVFIGASV